MDEEIADNRFKCQFCLKSFKKKLDLIRHERTHTGEKPFQCEICKKTFAQKGDLVRHERIHTGEKPFKCGVCSKKFPDLGNLNRHLKIHTGVKNFKCDVCGKHFTQKASLSLHLKIHIGDKNFACNICDKSFTLKFTLDQHLKVHTGEKPYKCKICDKSFSHKRSLDVHMVVHTGEKPYSCDNCDKSYADPSGLRHHRKRCNGQSLQNETASISELQDETVLQREENIDNTGNNSNHTENNFIEISDIIKSEISESQEKFRQQEISAITSYNPYLCVECWSSFSIESDFINHKITCHGNTSSLQNLEFVDCGETMKQEIKEECETEHEVNPLHFVKSELCEAKIESCEVNLETELQDRLIDSKGTIKLEIKQE